MQDRPEKNIIDQLADILVQGKVDANSRERIGEVLKTTAALLNDKTHPLQVTAVLLGRMRPWVVSGIALAGGVASVVALAH